MRNYVIEVRINGRVEPSAPSLAVYEVGNVLWKHLQITSEKAYEFVARFLSLQISLVDVWSDARLLRNVCTLAKTKNITFYDVSYLCLAEREKAKLITADEELWKKMPNNMVLLKNFKANDSLLKV